MALSITTNLAANAVHRNLERIETEISRSVARLSSGKRILSARDDPASLAVGARVQAEVYALGSAQQNAALADSLLQVVEGQLNTISEIVVRIKTLAIQASAGLYDDVDRSLIDAEVQQLLQEVDRISEDSAFNNRRLLGGGDEYTLFTAAEPTNDGVSNIAFSRTTSPNESFRYAYDANEEIFSLIRYSSNETPSYNVVEAGGGAATSLATNALSVRFNSTPIDGVFAYSYDTTTQIFTVTNVATGESRGVSIQQSFDSAFGVGVNQIPSNRALDVSFAEFGLTVTLEEGFARNTTIAPSGTQFTISADPSTQAALSGGAFNLSFAVNRLSPGALAALQALAGYDATTGLLSLASTVASGSTYALDGVEGFSWGSAATGDSSAAITVGSSASQTLFHNGIAVATLDLSGVALASSVTSGDSFTLDLALGTLFASQISNTTVAPETVTIDISERLDATTGAGSNLSPGEELALNFEQFGVLITLDHLFDRGQSISSATDLRGSLPSEITSGTTPSFRLNSRNITPSVYQTLRALAAAQGSGDQGYSVVSGLLSFEVERDAAGAVTLIAAAGFDLGLGVGNASRDLSGGPRSTEIAVTVEGQRVVLGTLETDFDASGTAGPLGTFQIGIGSTAFFNALQEGSSSIEYNFRIGTGNDASDRLTLTIETTNTRTLGIEYLAVSTTEGSNAAVSDIEVAINRLQQTRSNIGALQNRLERAGDNLAVFSENVEAARSNILDLDVAREAVVFTSRQVLSQAAISILAQANQLSQNILRLFQ